jgi:hypothetical protein
VGCFHPTIVLRHIANSKKDTCMVMMQFVNL